MIRHRNYYAMVQKGDELEERLTRPGDVMLLYLPLAHNYGRLLHLSAAYIGFTVAFLRRPAPHRRRAATRPADDLPERSAGVREDPRRGRRPVRERACREAAHRATGRSRWGTASRVCARPSSRCRRSSRPQYRLADRLVYSQVRRGSAAAADREAGGAPLGREVAEFFHAIDILILEGYGLSEVTTAATVNRPSDFKFGTVGKPMPGVEIRIAEDGEILIRSNTVFAGYYHDPEATREVLDDEGFVHTGDVGHLDEDGFLVITDRKKDIIVTAGGKNVAPQNLENDLKGHRLVSQALVVGDRMPYIAALVTVDPEPAQRRSTPTRCELACRQAVDDVNRDRSGFEQIKRFLVLPREFGAERGRGDADAEAPPQGDPRALRGRGRRALRASARPSSADLEILRAPTYASWYDESAVTWTSVPVCGAWTNSPPPMYIPTWPSPSKKRMSPGSS